MKILLPVDGSDYTKRMLGYIAARDDVLGRDNDYLVYTAVAPIPAYATRFLDKDNVEGYYRDEAEVVLRPIRAFAAQRGWKAEFIHGHGHASDAIAAIAQTYKSDLIVMGTHGQTALGNVVLGSVATGVLARSKTPVLLVR
jgi:nucleotide-binding universal stress UspA family protein